MSRTEWENPDVFPDFTMWITKRKDSNRFHFKFCLVVSLTLVSMEATALKKHMS